MKSCYDGNNPAIGIRITTTSLAAANTVLRNLRILKSTRTFQIFLELKHQ